MDSKKNLSKLQINFGNESFLIEECFLSALAYLKQTSYLPSQYPKASAVRVSLRNPREGLVQIAIALLQDLQPVLDIKAIYEDTPSLKFYDEFVPPSQEESENHKLKYIKKILSGTIGFLTSGSTGKAKIVRKKLRFLLKEVKVIQEIYKIPAGGMIVSFVNIFHIYGFIHGLLMAIRSKNHLAIVDRSFDFLENKKYRHYRKISIVLIVPSLWSLAKKIIERLDVKILISSGNSFGKKRSQELLDIKRAPLSYEFFGSTETGGIAYRCINNNQSSFSLLPGLSLVSDEGKWLLKSQSETFCLDDRFYLLNSKEFIHLGRSDQVFKWSGQRFSLRKIENNLKSLMGVSDVFCHFTVKESVIQGGLLTAWIEGKNKPYLNVKKTYRKKFLGEPFPQKIVYLASLPRDEHGKIQADVLLTNP